MLYMYGYNFGKNKGLELPLFAAIFIHEVLYSKRKLLANTEASS